jgi:cold shock CspA family protein
MGDRCETTAAGLLEGVVRHVAPSGRWGLVAEGGRKYYVHRDDCDFLVLEVGQVVVFESTSNERGRRAINVRLVGRRVGRGPMRGGGGVTR